MLCLLNRVLLEPRLRAKAPESGLDTGEADDPALGLPPQVYGRFSGELERGECWTTVGDWQPGVLRTRDKCSSRMAWGSSSEEPDRRARGCGESCGALTEISESSLSSSWETKARKR